MSSCLPVTVEIGRGDLVSVTGSELLTRENQLDTQLTFSFFHFGENDNLAGAVGSRGSGCITDFTAEILAGCHAHSCGGVTQKWQK